MAGESGGVFVLGVKIENIAQEIERLKELAKTAEQVQSKLNSLGSAKKVAVDVSATKELAKSFGDINKFNDALSKSIKYQKESIDKLKKGYREAINEAKKLQKTLSTTAGTNPFNKSTQGAKEFNNMMSIAIGKIIRYRIAFGAWRQVVQSLKDIIDVTIKLNQVMTDLKKVMSPINTDFKYLTNVAFVLGEKFGQSAVQVAESMKVWAQQGKTMEEVASLTEATLIGVTSANLSAQEAVEALTAATKAYDVEATNATEINDKWMAVQAAHAVTAQDLANATKLVASAAKAAGVDIDELNGVIAAIGSVTRKSGKAVANSFKTMMARMNKNPAIQSFQDLGIAVMKSRTEMRPMMNVLEDLSKQWGTLSDATKRSIAVTVGGIRRYADFMVLMDNFDEYLKATSDSYNAFGDAQVASQKQVESYSSKLQKIKTAFEKLGNAIGTSGLLDIIVRVSKHLATFATAVGKIIAPIGLFVKSIGALGAVMAVTVLTMKTLLMVGGAMSKAFKGVSASIKETALSFVALKTAEEGAAEAGAAATTAAVSLGTKLSAIGAVIAGLVVLWEAASYFFSDMGNHDKDFKAMQDSAMATIYELHKMTKEYALQRKEVADLIEARKNYIEEGKKEGKSGTELEVYATNKLIDNYGKLIKKHTELRDISADNGLDLSMKSLEASQKNLANRYDETRATAVENAIITKRAYDEQIAKVKELGIAIKAAKEEANKPTKPIEETKLVRTTKVGGFHYDKVFTQFWKDAIEASKNVFKKLNVSEDISKPLLDNLIDGLNKAAKASSMEEFEHIMTTKVRDALTKIMGIASAKTDDIDKKIKDLVKVIDGGAPKKIKLADSMYYVDDAANKLIGKMVELTKASSLFGAQNKRIKEDMQAIGIGYNEASAAVSFHKKQMLAYYNMVSTHEAKIARERQKLATMVASNVVPDTEVVAQRKKVEVLEREKLAVSKLADEWDAEKKAIEDKFNAELKGYQDTIIEKHRSQQSTTEEVTLARKAADAAQAEIKALREKYTKLMNAAGAYGKIYAAARNERDAAKEAKKAELELARAVDEVNKKYRDNKNQLSSTLAILNLRGAAEERIIAAKIESYQWSIDQYKIDAAMMKEGADKSKILDKILALEHKIAKEKEKQANITNKINVAKDQEALTLALSKQKAVTDIQTSNMKLQHDSAFRLLKLERDRAIIQAQQEEYLRKQLDLNDNEEDAIKRRVALSKKLLAIEKKIYEERINIIKAYKDQLAQVSSELSSNFASGLGSWVSRETTRYERLGTIAQDIADAQRNVDVANLKGDEEGIYDAKKALNDLLDEQEKLNYATAIWGNMLKDIGMTMAETINKKLADQFVNSLMDYNIGDTSLGEAMSRGIVIKSSLVSDSEILVNGIKDASVFAADVIGNSIIAAGNFVASTFSSSKTETGSLFTDANPKYLNEVGQEIINSTKSGAKVIGDSIDKSTAKYGKAALTVGEINASRLSTALMAAGKMVGNYIGSVLGGGGPLASIGASIGGMIPGALKMTGWMGMLTGIGASLLGGVFGGFFDKQPEVNKKPIFDTSSNKPVPVTIEGINRQEVMLHDISIGVEANFLDASQLDPIMMRNLAEHIRNETEDLLKRENIWNG